MPLMQSSINDILNTRSQEEIEATLDYFDALPLRLMRKKELVRKLASYLSAPEVWLDKLMEQDLRLLQTLCKAGPGNTVEMIPGDFPSVVEVLRFVDATKPASGEDMQSLSIPSAFYELISKEIDNVISRKERDGSFALEHLILGAVNIYGIVPLRTFVDCIFEDFEDYTAMHEFAMNVARHPVVRLYQEEYRGESYLVSPYVENFEETMKIRRERYKQVRKYAKTSHEKARNCGEKAPFCCYGLDTPEGMALTDMLSNLGYEGDSLDASAHSVWLNAQYEPDPHNLDMLMSPLSAAAEDVDTIDRFAEYAQVILDYANSVPKWLLKGHSANETGLMLYSVTDEYLEDLYGLELSESENEEVMRFFDSVHKVRPVAPDEPCPCGSGLSYRLCHGKLYS